ncbi:MAG: S-layer family protein [Nitrospiraceae bacterium]|nr:MAG: S-layer family protein [Nitrospiraceae bacterium]
MKSGTIRINADQLMVDASQFEANTGSESGGGIIFIGKVGEFKNGSTIQSSTFGSGTAGKIIFTATDRLTLSDDTSASGADIRPTGLFTTAIRGTGDAAEITVTTSLLEMTGGARFDATTRTSAGGGHITIVADQVSISGERTAPIFEGPLFGLAGRLSSGIYSRTVGSQFCTGPCGDAGNVTITTGSLNLSNGAVLDSSTTTSGLGGDITVHATDTITIVGTMEDETPGGIFTNTQGTGAGGNIFINANSVTLQNGGTLSAATSGTDTTATGGTITVEGNTVQLNSGGSITAQSTGSGNAGNVTIQGHASPADSVVISGFDENFNPSGIFTDTQATGAGGNIHISAKSISLQDGGTLSATTSGTAPTATGGTITIDAESLSMDSATITAETRADNTGRAGDVTISAMTIDTANFSFITTLSTGIGQAGDISLSATDRITLIDSFVNSDAASFSTTTAGNGGFIHLHAPMIDLQSTLLGTTTLGAGNAGNLLLEAQQLSIRASDFGRTITTGSILATQTQGSGNAGTVTIRGIEPKDSSAKVVTITDASQLRSLTIGSGNAGNISIAAAQLTLTEDGNLSSSTLDGTGAGGSINLFTDSFTMQNGSTLSAKTTGAGDAGNVTIQGLASHTQSVLIDGSGIFTDTQGTGAGGNIFVSANSVTLQNGGALSATTSGTQATATGGTITVHANQVQLNDQATITATSTRLFDKPNSGAGNAGTITVTAEESIVLLGNSSITSSAGAEGNGGLVSLTAPSIELHGNSNIGTSTAGLGNAGNIELQGNQVNLRTDSFVTARTQAEGRGGNITIRGLTGEGSRATDISLSDNSQLVSETIGDGEHIQGAAGNILIETARLNLSGGSLFNTTSRGSTGAAGNIIVNATDSLTISGHGTQLVSDSMEFSFGDAGNISISAPSVVIENNGGISTSTSLVGNAGTITVKTNNLQLLSGGHITSSSLAEVPELSSGAAGTVSIQGLASPAQSVFIDGPASGIFTDTRGSGLGGNITLNANTVALQDGGALSAKTSGTAPSATGGTITIDAADTFSMSNRASINASSPGGADAGSINITAMNGFTMQNSTITTEAGQGAGGGDIKVTTSPDATVLL